MTAYKFWAWYWMLAAVGVFALLVAVVFAARPATLIPAADIDAQCHYGPSINVDQVEPRPR